MSRYFARAVDAFPTGRANGGLAFGRSGKALLAFVGFALVLLASLMPDLGCSTAPTTGKPLVIGTTMDVKDVGLDDYYAGILRSVFTHSGLVSLDADGNYVGDLAHSFETKDGKTWTFKLKKGIKWHDGQPFGAEDVKFSMEYLLEKLPVYRSHWAIVNSVEAPDENTVVITLKQPNARFLVNLLVLRTIPKHIFEKVKDPKTFTDPAAMVGTGPYVFDRFDKAAGLLIFKKNRDYFGEKPTVSEVHVRLFKNPDTMYMALEKGELDTVYFYAAGTDPVYVPRLMKDGKIKFMFTNNLGVPNALFFNVEKAPVDDPRFRRALAYAIDYEELQRIFTAGYGKVPNAGFVPEGTPGYVQTPKMRQDIAQSTSILDSMGYKDRNGDSYRETTEGKPLVLDLMVRGDLAESVRLAELLKRYFEAVGVRISLRTVDSAAFKNIADIEKSHVAFISRTTPWGMITWGGYGTGYFDSRNIGWTQVKDPEFHKLVDEILTELDSSRQKQIAARIQEYYADNLPAVPLYWNTLVQPYSERYQGWYVDPLNGILNKTTWSRLTSSNPERKVPS